MVSAHTIYTIGHSTRPVDEFIAMLTVHDVDTLVDIRTMPRSRYNPQFNSSALEASLRESGLGYVWVKELGGLRKPHKDSQNLGWRNDSFRGYADYMQTDEFKHALRRVITLSKKHVVALMCAESVPWRCHRSLVADALTVQGVSVQHIMTQALATPHVLTSFAYVEDGELTYPPEEDLFTAQRKKKLEKASSEA